MENSPQYNLDLSEGLKTVLVLTRPYIKLQNELLNPYRIIDFTDGGRLHLQ